MSVSVFTKTVVSFLSFPFASFFSPMPSLYPLFLSDLKTYFPLKYPFCIFSRFPTLPPLVLCSLYFFCFSFVTWKLCAAISPVVPCELSAVSLLLPFLSTFLPSQKIRFSHSVLLVCVWVFGPSVCVSQSSVNQTNSNQLKGDVFCGVPEVSKL